jgi:hypothetical protein
VKKPREMLARTPKFARLDNGRDAKGRWSSPGSASGSASKTVPGRGAEPPQARQAREPSGALGGGGDAKKLPRWLEAYLE